MRSTIIVWCASENANCSSELTSAVRGRPAGAGSRAEIPRQPTPIGRRKRMIARQSPNALISPRPLASTQDGDGLCRSATPHSIRETACGSSEDPLSGTLRLAPGPSEHPLTHGRASQRTDRYRPGSAGCSAPVERFAGRPRQLASRPQPGTRCRMRMAFPVDSGCCEGRIRPRQGCGPEPSKCRWSPARFRVSRSRLITPVCGLNI